MHDKFETHLDCGPDGLLYDRRVREFMQSTSAADKASGEALAALRAASHTFRLRMDRWLERHGLSESRLSLLFRLSRIGDVTLGDLADSLDVSARNVTGLVDLLERDGLVERFPDPDDRRATRVKISPAGRTKLDEIGAEKNGAQDELVAGFTEAELKQLRHLLLKLVQNFNANLNKELERV
jgi:DNA-binding MarR family transcriptional regulator